MLYSYYVWLVGFLLVWASHFSIIREVNTNMLIFGATGLILMLLAPALICKK